MILDTSAVVAIVRREPRYEVMRHAAATADHLGIGAPTLFEAELVLMSRLNAARGLVSGLLQEFEVSVVPFTSAHAGEALSAFRRYGKGRHEARLNLGDCMAYAVASIAGEELLCRGDDFTKTDLSVVSL